MVSFVLNSSFVHVCIWLTQWFVTTRPPKSWIYRLPFIWSGFRSFPFPTTQTERVLRELSWENGSEITVTGPRPPSCCMWKWGNQNWFFGLESATLNHYTKLPCTWVSTHNRTGRCGLLGRPSFLTFNGFWQPHRTVGLFISVCRFNPKIRKKTPLEWKSRLMLWSQLIAITYKVLIWMYVWDPHTVYVHNKFPYIKVTSCFKVLILLLYWWGRAFDNSVLTWMEMVKNHWVNQKNSSVGLRIRQKMTHGQVSATEKPQEE